MFKPYMKSKQLIGYQLFVKNCSEYFDCTAYNKCRHLFLIYAVLQKRFLFFTYSKKVKVDAFVIRMIFNEKDEFLSYIMNYKDMANYITYLGVKKENRVDISFVNQFRKVNLF